MHREDINRVKSGYLFEHWYFLLLSLIDISIKLLKSFSQWQTTLNRASASMDCATVNSTNKNVQTGFIRRFVSLNRDISDVEMIMSNEISIL